MSFELYRFEGVLYNMSHVQKLAAQFYYCYASRLLALQYSKLETRYSFCKRVKYWLSKRCHYLRNYFKMIRINKLRTNCNHKFIFFTEMLQPFLQLKEGTIDTGEARWGVKSINLSGANMNRTYWQYFLLCLKTKHYLTLHYFAKVIILIYSLESGSEFISFDVNKNVYFQYVMYLIPFRSNLQSTSLSFSSMQPSFRNFIQSYLTTNYKQ